MNYALVLAAAYSKITVFRNKNIASLADDFKVAQSSIISSSMLILYSSDTVQKFTNPDNILYNMLHI